MSEGPKEDETLQWMVVNDLVEESAKKKGSGKKGGEGCYIATCVYGSYDCPEVWTLRRFRDGTLRRTAAGSLLVRLYYAVSPGLVRRFGRAEGVRGAVRGLLNRVVARLRKKGISAAPYTDPASVRR